MTQEDVPGSFYWPWRSSAAGGGERTLTVGAERVFKIVLKPVARRPLGRRDINSFQAEMDLPAAGKRASAETPASASKRRRPDSIVSGPSGSFQLASGLALSAALEQPAFTPAEAELVAPLLAKMRAGDGVTSRRRPKPTFVLQFRSQLPPSTPPLPPVHAAPRIDSGAPTVAQQTSGTREDDAPACTRELRTPVASRLPSAPLVPYEETPSWPASLRSSDVWRTWSRGQAYAGSPVDYSPIAPALLAPTPGPRTRAAAPSATTPGRARCTAACVQTTPGLVRTEPPPPGNSQELSTIGFMTLLTFLQQQTTQPTVPAEGASAQQAVGNASRREALLQQAALPDASAGSPELPEALTASEEDDDDADERSDGSAGADEGTVPEAEQSMDLDGSSMSADDAGADAEEEEEEASPVAAMTDAEDEAAERPEAALGDLQAGHREEQTHSPAKARHPEPVASSVAGQEEEYSEIFGGGDGCGYVSNDDATELPGAADTQPAAAASLGGLFTVQPRARPLPKTPNARLKRDFRSRKSLAGAGLVFSSNSSGVSVRRSQRERLRPLEYWRNEKIEYTRTESSTLPTITKVYVRSSEPSWPAPAPRRDPDAVRVRHPVDDPRQLGERSHLIMTAFTPNAPLAAGRKQSRTVAVGKVKGAKAAGQQARLALEDLSPRKGSPEAGDAI